MLKKLVVGTLSVGMIGILAFGAINRTLDRTDRVAAAQGRNWDSGRSLEDQNGRGGFGQEGAQRGAAGRGYSRDVTVPANWETFEGVVVQAPEVGGELVIETDDGEELTIGTGPSYMAAQGFALQTGERVQVHGYWEGSELKATQITRMADGQILQLRDAYGRPAWAGAGSNNQGRAAETPGDQSGTGQAQVDAWLQLQGSVVSVDGDALTVRTADGEQIVVENRPWWFAQEQGFSVQVGDQVTLTGFYEGGDFEVGRIDNITLGQTVLIRDENGRPMWAGRGRRGA